MEMATIGVHGGRSDLGHAPFPIDLSTTYRTADLPAATESIDAMAAGELPSGTPVYQRLHNPTVHRMEEALAVMEGASAAVSFASGMGAVAAAYWRPRWWDAMWWLYGLYGGTDHLLASGCWIWRCRGPS